MTAVELLVVLEERGPAGPSRLTLCGMFDSSITRTISSTSSSVRFCGCVWTLMHGNFARVRMFSGALSSVFGRNSSRYSRLPLGASAATRTTDAREHTTARVFAKADRNRMGFPEIAAGRRDGGR